jgi:hypothetical protein
VMVNGKTVKTIDVHAHRSDIFRPSILQLSGRGPKAERGRKIYADEIGIEGVTSTLTANVCIKSAGLVEPLQKRKKTSD